VTTGLSGYVFHRNAGVQTWVDNDFGNNGLWPGGSAADGTILDLSTKTPGDFSQAFREDGFVYGKFKGWSAYVAARCLSPTTQADGRGALQLGHEVFSFERAGSRGPAGQCREGLRLRLLQLGFWLSNPLAATRTWTNISGRAAPEL